MFEKLHIKITIFATLIATIYCIIFSDSFKNSCLTIIATISVFYIISGFISINLKNFKENLDNELQNNELQDDNIKKHNSSQNIKESSENIVK